ncbi:MAG: MBOAT family protein [Bacteroidales bacterium]|nr:MBOAT family protein [Bacteroidales bacterium]
MLFNSIEFLIFLPIVFCIYWLLHRRLLWQNAFVVAASYLFYGWWDWRFLLLIAFTTLCSFASGIAITNARQRDNDKWPSAKFYLWANIVVNLLILGLFKYYDFFAQSFADAFLGGNADRLLLHLVLPVGISFYTFQALSYSIDVYRGVIQPTRNAVAFFAYVSFFPQLVAGPIERATSLLPQFEQPRRFDYRTAVDGLRQMLWGFFKKMVVADSCAIYVDNIFDHPYWFNGASLLLAAVLFTIQIYGDFSGYSDIAIGCAKLFGIRLRRNFNVPYFSRDIAEFWRRWHISLTTWFRDYIYIPMGGSRVPKGRVLLNTLVIFLVSGLWHGANWTFVAWGAYHALLFLPLILMGRNRKYRNVVAEGRALPSLRELGQMLVTFFLAVMGWILFRADSIAEAWQYYVHMFSTLFDGSPTLTSNMDAWVVFVAVTVMTVVEWLNRGREHEFQRQPRCRALRWAGYTALIFMIGAYMVTNEMPFIYFQF